MAATPRIGLALGAGGTIGWTFHLGVLEGLRAVTGLGPADLVAIVGTSAGGAIAESRSSADPKPRTCSVGAGPSAWSGCCRPAPSPPSPCGASHWRA